MIWNFPRFFRVFSPAGGIFRNSEPVWCPHCFLCLLFPGKGKRTAFSFASPKRKRLAKEKRPGKTFGWFPRTPSIDQSLALDLRRMEVGESTIDFVGADAERSCSRRRSVTDAACPLRVLIGLRFAAPFPFLLQKRKRCRAAKGKEGCAKPEVHPVPPSRQKKPAPFRFRRGGENSISAAFFFLPKL